MLRGPRKRRSIKKDQPPIYFGPDVHPIAAAFTTGHSFTFDFNAAVVWDGISLPQIGVRNTDDNSFSPATHIVQTSPTRLTITTAVAVGTDSCQASIYDTVGCNKAFGRNILGPYALLLNV